MRLTADFDDLVSTVTIFTDEHGAAALLALRDVPAGSCRCSRPTSAISPMTNPSRSPQ